MKRISRNISIILRSERLIAQRQLAVLRRQTGLMAAAGIAAAVALVMVNVAAFLALSDVMSPASAALIIAIANVALAVILASVAGKADASAETAPVAEVRDLALEDLEAELRLAADEAKAATESLKKLSRDPLGALAPGLAGNVAKAVMKNLKS